MDDSKKNPSIPSWQQSPERSTQSPSIKQQHTSDPTTQLSHAELLEQAREFLQNDSIRNASRDRKVDFLRTKGLQDGDIEELLQRDAPTPSGEQQSTEELKTVHDSTQGDAQKNGLAQIKEEQDDSTTASSSTKMVSSPSSQQEPLPQIKQALSQSLSSPQRSDSPSPIITYPEFLLKPEKPPPLITISRLVNAAYAFAGLATLTYSASKYIVEPMLESLTEARHALADTAIADLDKLNDKLESSVSHVPYIASAATRHKSSRHHHRSGDDEDINSDNEDEESLTSDPTELFHRDIATQTTPNLSRTHSETKIGTFSSTSGTGTTANHLDATTTQIQRLTQLHTTLVSLQESLDPIATTTTNNDDTHATRAAGMGGSSYNHHNRTPATTKLHETLSDFQTVLNKLEATYNPLRGDYYYTSNSGSSSSSNIYSSSTKSGGGKDNLTNNNSNVDIVAKVRTEIRNLKGAFLSSRNFPTAPRPGVAAASGSYGSNSR